MPWVRIPPDRLEHLPLFGYDKIAEDDNFAWYHGPRGRMRVEKDDPRVFLVDDVDAMQLGALEILVDSSDQPT